ncbi:MAG: molybdopterin oxidoreductase [Verrucomicrobia bacterium]|nr:molybdopterin oxidoreductase [Verrucomicrobiota bacterium]
MIYPPSTQTSPESSCEAAAGGLGLHRNGGRHEISTWVDLLLEEQRSLTLVEDFARAHKLGDLPRARTYSKLLPASQPGPGQQMAFEVDLDACSGCKACVTACHSLNGLEEGETWRSVGQLIPEDDAPGSRQQHVTTACHHCVDPGCLNGCPVLAYDKDPVSGIVRHLDDQCIGCQYCVMKCPYEVPKYSKRLGIVRKCDLCTSRLAVGEAPACAQGCPNEAIRITLVDSAEISAKLAMKGGQNLFLPSSPSPTITTPTTLYRSARPLTSQRAADSLQLRLEPAHWPLVFMLLLTQASAGLFACAAVLALAGMLFPLQWMAATGTALLLLGLFGAGLHLGQPLRAWRAFMGWRRSWLSREIIAFSLALPCAAAATWSAWFAPQHSLFKLSLILAATSSLAGVVMSIQVYVDTRRPAWAGLVTWPSFLRATVRMGCLLAAACIGFHVSSATEESRQWKQILLAVALIAPLSQSVWHRILNTTALKNPDSPRHRNARVETEVLQKTLHASRLLNTGAAIIALGFITGLLASPAGAVLGLTAAGAAELLHRWRFFVAAQPPRMPGGIGS